MRRIEEKKQERSRDNKKHGKEGEKQIEREQ